ncbi:Ankyrin 2, partial [Fasciola hepatica]
MRKSRREQRDGERRRKNRQSLSCSLFACLPSTKIPSFVHRTRSLPPRADVTSISHDSYQSHSNERLRADGQKLHRIKTITWPVRKKPTDSSRFIPTNGTDDTADNGVNGHKNETGEPDPITTTPESATGSMPVAGRTHDLRNRRSKRSGRKSSKLSKRHVTISNATEQQSDAGQSFLRAARAGNLNKVIELLKSGVEVDTTNANGLTALHLASKEAQIDVVRELLKRGASVQMVTKKGNTALHIASLAGHIDIVKLLMEYGANVNAQSQNGFTPLYMAAQENHVEVVNHLLNNGANPALSTEDGFTPLAVALQQGHDRVVAILLEKDSKGKTRLPALHVAAKKNDVHSATLLLNNSDVNVDHPSASGFTPLHIAAHYGNLNISKLLIERGANVNHNAKNSITPLHVATKWGKDEVVNELLNAGAEVDARTRDGLTPLHCAARSGHADVVETLLKRGANANLKTRNDLSPLHMTAQGDHEKAAQALLITGANPDAVTVDYLTPLHVAAHCGNVNVARTLLESHCNVNARALNGFTALHIAGKKAKIPLVELLLKNGALLEAATETGLTPLHVASFVGSTEAVALLLQHGANVNQTTLRNETPLHLAARNKQLETAKVLLNHGAILDARTRDNQTPLHIAIRSGFLPLVQLLLDAGADTTATTRDGYSALHLATKEESEEIVVALLERGAASDLKTKKGFTPLHLAAKSGNVAIAQILLERAKADPNATGKSGFTPVHVASYYNQSPVLKLLTEHGADVNKPVRNGFTPLHLTAKSNNLASAEVLVQNGATVDVGSRNGYTPLHLAAQDGQIEFVDTLVNKYRADPACAAQDGLTPLHLAVQEDKVSVAECLLNAGASIDARTQEAGFTPLHTAAYRGQLASVRLLLTRLADAGRTDAVNARTSMGSTPLHLAAQQGHLQVVLKLLQSGADPNTRNRQGWTAAQLAYKQHYLNLFEALQKVTTNVKDWSQPSLTGAGPDGLCDGDPNMVTGSISLEKVEHMIDHVISDSDEEGGELIPTPALLRRYQKPSPSVDKQDDKWSRTESYDLICQQLEYMKNHSDVTDETTIPSTPMLRVGPDVIRPASLIVTSRQGVQRDEPVRSSVYDSITDERPKSYMSDQISPDVVNRQMISVQETKASPAAISAWSFDADNLQLMRKPIKSGFLISFLVDARGCLVEAQRRADLRFYIPPNACPRPTRIICRILRPEFAPNGPSMNDGDCLAARILEMGPYQAQFALPILIEVPHIASLRGHEREIIVLRSETGNTWKEHQMDATDQAVHDALGDAFDRVEPSSALTERRIHRILTTDFPQYFALLSRFRQEITLVGSDGGLISSTVCPQVQAVFPPGALQKKIKVGLQAQPIARELVTRLVGPRVSVSSVVSVEPRRRKFHKPITLTIPLPRPPPKVDPGATPNVRLLCSLSGGTNPAVWEDITGTTPLTRHKDCVSFTTTVSARLWLIDCPNSALAVEIANRIYRESIVPPIVGRFAVYTRQSMNLDTASMPIDGVTNITGTPRIRQSGMELAQIRCLCLTDDNEDKTLECLERFGLVAVGASSELLEDHPYWIEMTGNLVPITKADSQPHLIVRPFQDNRITFPVRIRSDTLETEKDEAMVSGKIHFMRDPRHLVREPEDISPPQRPVTTLDIHLPRPGQSVLIVTADSEILGRSELDRMKVARQLGADWERLAVQLQFNPVELETIRYARTTTGPMSDQEKAALMLGLWQQKAVDAGLTEQDALGNRLADALKAIHRSDVIHPSMTAVRPVWAEEERTVAMAILDKKMALPRVEEVSAEREKVEQAESGQATPVPRPTTPTAITELARPLQVAPVPGAVVEQPAELPTERDVTFVSVAEITPQLQVQPGAPAPPVEIPEAVVSPVAGAAQPGIVPSAEPKWQTEFLDQVDREQLPTVTKLHQIEVQVDGMVTQPMVEHEAEGVTEWPPFLTEAKFAPVVAEVPAPVTAVIPPTRLYEPMVHDMFVGPEVSGAAVPEKLEEIPGSPVVIPTRMAEVPETGVPQLIQGNREEEEIREEQIIPPKVGLKDVGVEYVPTESVEDWKAQLLEHLQITGVEPEPVPVSTTAAVPGEPEQLVPDDQLQAAIHVRHPDVVSAVPETEIRPADREARLLIAQELAETVGEEEVSPVPAPDTISGIVEEPIIPVAAERRVVQIPTTAEPVAVLAVEPMEQAPTAVSEQIVESRFEREVEAPRPEITIPVMDYYEPPTEVIPTEPTITQLEQELIPGVREPAEKLEELIFAPAVETVGEVEKTVEAPAYPVVQELRAEVWPTPAEPIHLVDEEELELPPEHSDEEGFEHIYHEAALLEAEAGSPPKAEVMLRPSKPQVPTEVGWEPVGPAEMELDATLVMEAMAESAPQAPVQAKISPFTTFPPGSAGHDVVQSSPEESHEFRDVEEVLPDGTVIKTRTATAETVQSVSCRNWEEGVDAATESGAYTIEEPEETTEIEEVEEVLPDGTVITRLVTTKHIIDRVTEHAVSDEVIQPEETEFIQLPQQPETTQPHEQPPQPSPEQLQAEMKQLSEAGWEIATENYIRQLTEDNESPIEILGIREEAAANETVIVHAAPELTEEVPTETKRVLQIADLQTSMEENLVEVQKTFEHPMDIAMIQAESTELEEIDGGAQEVTKTEEYSRMELAFQGGSQKPEERYTTTIATQEKTPPEKDQDAQTEEKQMEEPAPEYKLDADGHEKALVKRKPGKGEREDEVELEALVEAEVAPEAGAEVEV